ncbi:MAG: Ppx/GppA phosphatase family protein [Sphingomonadales bacterium]
MGSFLKKGENSPKGQQYNKPNLDNNFKGYRGRNAVYSALDLGTNNCRLLVATPTSAGFRVIDSFSRIVKLGEGLTRTHRLSEESMDRAIKAIQVCANKISKRGVTHMRSVATEACRFADNSGDFVSRVLNETGIALDVISSNEEARLAVMGCQTLFNPKINKAVVFDIGGGSTELIGVEVMEDKSLKILATTSMPLGVVRLAEALNGDKVNSKDYQDIVLTVRERLLAFDKELNLGDAFEKGEVQLLGSSGTVTTLASIQLGLNVYDRSKVDGCIIPINEMRTLTHNVGHMTWAERVSCGCIGEERANMVVPGCAIFEAILDMWPLVHIKIADRGIREGIIRSIMNQIAGRNSVYK